MRAWTPEEHYGKLLKSCRLLSREEECELARHSQAGDREAFEVLFRSQFRMVVKIATKRAVPRGITRDDLIQEGSIGLMESISKFNPKHGCRLSTYAFRNIHNSVKRAIKRKSRVVHIPETATETMEKRGLSVPMQGSIHEGPDGEDWSGQIPAIEQEPDPPLYGNSVKAQLRMALHSLDPRTRGIVTCRLKGKLLHEIGSALGITKERVRQIEAAGLEEVKRQMRKCQLDEAGELVAV